MRFILSFRHWQIFIIFISYELIIIGLFAITEINPLLIIGTILISIIPLLLYPLLISISLFRYILTSNENIKNEYKSFIIFSILLVLTLVINESVADNNKMIKGLLSLITLYLLFRFFQFPSRTINRIELKQNVRLWDYIIDSFQILFWPFFIWWIQPRINKINDKYYGAD